MDYVQRMEFLAFILLEVALQITSCFLFIRVRKMCVLLGLSRGACRFRPVLESA